MDKYSLIAQTITQRILRGDYQLTVFPTVRELAHDEHVSMATANKVMKSLQEAGLVMLGPKGRLEVTRRGAMNSSSRPLQVAFLSHTARTLRHVNNGRVDELRIAAERLGCAVRHVLYERWDDPVLMDTLQNFDGIFFEPFPNPPAEVITRLRQAQHLVIFNFDYSSYGLPSLQTFPPVFVQRLLEHLEALGHTHIDCLNVQPVDENVNARIAQWEIWMAVHGYNGQLINEPVALGSSAFEQAYQVTHRCLETREFAGTALLCITGAAAVGAMRAFHERGIRIGGDMALCATHAEYGPYLESSLTTLRNSDAIPLFTYCLQWMQKDTPWRGPLLLQPESTEVVVGETTVPKVLTER